MIRLAKATASQDHLNIERLAIVTREIDSLAANMLAGVASPTLWKLLTNREVEKATLEAQLSAPYIALHSAAILPYPGLRVLFEDKVARLRQTLDDEAIHGEAAEILSTLIASVTIYPDGKTGPEAEVVAKVADLVAWATNDDAATEGGVGSSITLVAGTGFEPVTFRL